jgi:hypothetical protein
VATRAVIFAGPSLRPPRPQPADLEFRPPAARGDLRDAVREGVSTIGLIDGVFSQSLAVTPLEVREAAATGARLYGGASMGALRACECPDAIAGVGVIWQAFVEGTISDDDEVAVTYLPDTFELVTHPLVQVREAVRLALLRHPPARPALADFLESVRSHPFHHRTLDVIRRSASSVIAAGIPWDAMAEWLTDPRHDLKRADALAVVRRVEDGCGWSVE